MENTAFEPDSKLPAYSDLTPLTFKAGNESLESPGSLAVASNGNAKVLKTDTVPESTVHMKRQIGIFGGIAMIIGTMIGSGIFISPYLVLTRSGGSVSVSLLIWFFCGILSTLSALTYCELGLMIPKSGGEHVYFQAAFKSLNPFWGEVPAFLFAFMTVLLLKPQSLAILSITFAQYTILPIIDTIGIADNWSKSGEHELAQKFIAIACALLVSFVNILSAKVSARIQIAFTVSKLLACSLVIGIGIYNLSIGKTGSLPTDGFDTPKVTASGIALAFYSGLWSYDGWNNLNYLTEELINPNRNLPLAIFIGIPLATLLYTFMNAAYFTALSTEEFLSGQPVGILLGDKMLGSFSFLMPVLVAVAVYGTANGSVFSAGRISYVAAREGHLVDILSFVHTKRLTPAAAIILNAMLGILFISFNSVNKLVDSFSIVSWLFYALAISSLFILRFRQPNLSRPFKVPIIFPAIALVMSIYLVSLPVIENPGVEHVYPLAFCLFGIIVYYPFVYKKYSLPFMRNATRFLQRLILVAPSPYKEE